MDIGKPEFFQSGTDISNNTYLNHSGIHILDNLDDDDVMKVSTTTSDPA